MYVSPNGHSFNGSWGYNGKKENGTFVANKVLPPSPVTAAGKWNVTAAGGPAAMVGKMACTQSGPSTVCKVGPVVINGKFRTSDKVRATWTNGDRTGLVLVLVQRRQQQLQRHLGLRLDDTTPVGRVIGQRSL